MTITCEYCNKTLCNEGNLRRHQKTKACNEARARPTSVSIEDRYQCESCLKFMSSPTRLVKHQDLCLARYKKLLEERQMFVQTLQLEIVDLRQQIVNVRLETELELLRNDSKESRGIIARIAEQPKVTNTHNTNNTLVLPVIDTTQERIDRAVESSYDMDHFCSGQKGVARFAVDHLLINDQRQLGYVCTDPARGTFKYIGEDGEIVRDVKATRLTTKLARPIKAKAGQLAGELVDMDKGNQELMNTANKNFQDVSGLEDDNTGFRTELAAVTVQS